VVRISGWLSCLPKYAIACLALLRFTLEAKVDLENIAETNY